MLRTSHRCSTRCVRLFQACECRPPLWRLSRAQHRQPLFAPPVNALFPLDAKTDLVSIFAAPAPAPDPVAEGQVDASLSHAPAPAPVNMPDIGQVPSFPVMGQAFPAPCLFVIVWSSDVDAVILILITGNRTDVAFKLRYRTSFPCQKTKLNTNRETALSVR